MLRAALRTSIAFSEGDITDFYFQQLTNCLDSNYEFTIKSGIFDCPQNAAIFGGNRSFPVSGVASDHNYSFTVDKSTRKAIWTNSPKDYSFQAKNAKYRELGVIGFGSPIN